MNNAKQESRYIVTVSDNLGALHSHSMTDTPQGIMEFVRHCFPGYRWVDMKKAK